MTPQNQLNQQDPLSPSSLLTEERGANKSKLGISKPSNDFGASRPDHTHEGIDIPGQVGDSILSPADGEVVFAGWQKGYGKVVYLKHPDGTTTRYGHLDQFKVELGDKIKQGVPIGLVGQTGNARGPHLHYERRDQNGLPMDPLLQDLFPSIGGKEAYDPLSPDSLVSQQDDLSPDNLLGEATAGIKGISKQSQTSVEIKDLDTSSIKDIPFEEDKGGDLSFYAEAARRAGESMTRPFHPLTPTHPDLIGKPLTIKFDHIPDSNDEVMDQILSKLGPDAVQANQSYRQETGRNLAFSSQDFSSLTKPTPDGKYQITVSPNQRLIRSINAYNKGGMFDLLLEKSKMDREKWQDLVDQSKSNSESALAKITKYIPGAGGKPIEGIDKGLAQGVIGDSQFLYNISMFAKATQTKLRYGVDSPEYKALEEEDSKNQSEINRAMGLVGKASTTGGQIIQGLTQGVVEFPQILASGGNLPISHYVRHLNEGQLEAGKGAIASIPMQALLHSLGGKLTESGVPRYQQELLNRGTLGSFNLATTPGGWQERSKAFATGALLPLPMSSGESPEVAQAKALDRFISLTQEFAKVKEGDLVSHSRTDIDGKPIGVVTKDGKVIVENSETQQGFSKVTNQKKDTSVERVEKIEEALPGMDKEKRDRLAKLLEVDPDQVESRLAEIKQEANQLPTQQTKVVPIPKAVEQEPQQVLVHIAGPSGSGKTEIMDALAKKVKNINFKDLDEFDDLAVSALGWEYKSKNDYTEEMLQQLHQKKQELIDEYLRTSDKPIVFFGHHVEADRELSIPAKERILLDVSPRTSALNAARRPGKTQEDLARDIKIGEEDVDYLKSRGYQARNPRRVYRDIIRLSQETPQPQPTETTLSKVPTSPSIEEGRLEEIGKAPLPQEEPKGVGVEQPPSSQSQATSQIKEEPNGQFSVIISVPQIGKVRKTYNTREEAEQALGLRAANPALQPESPEAPSYRTRADLEEAQTVIDRLHTNPARVEGLGNVSESRAKAYFKQLRAATEKYQPDLTSTVDHAEAAYYSQQIGTATAANEQALSKLHQTLTGMVTEDGAWLTTPEQVQEWGSRNKIITKESANQAKSDLSSIIKGGGSNDITQVFGRSLLPLVKLGAYHIEAGAREFQDWVKALANDLSADQFDILGPYLPDLYAASKSHLDAVYGPAAVEKINSLIKQAKPIRKETEALYTQERGKRVEAFSNTLTNLGGGEEAGSKALGKLKGELPKKAFEPIRKALSQQETDSLYAMISNHPDLGKWEKVKAVGALREILNPDITIAPTESNLAVLQKVYGKEFVKSVLKMRSFGQIVWDEFLSFTNIPRTVLASFDLSAPFRQGAILSAANPGKATRAFGSMLKAFGSESYADQVMQTIEKSPNAKLREDSGLYLSHWGAIGDTATAKEEFYQLTGTAESLIHSVDSWLEGHLSKKIGQYQVGYKGIKASERAYLVYLNKLRSDVFDGIANSNPDLTSKDLKGIATFINYATGRGDLGMLEKAAPILNNLFFSPRFTLSRFQVALTPFRGGTRTSKIYAARSLTRFVGAGLAVLGLAKAAGMQVDLDPRSAKFGKIQVGNTFIDPWGGMQQPARYVAQLISGQRVTVAGDKVTDVPREEVITRFARSKESPQFSFIHDSWLSKLQKNKATGESYHTDFVGNPVTPGSAIRERVVPLAWRDIYDAAEEDRRLGGSGIVGGLTGSLGIFGFGITTIPPKGVNYDPFGDLYTWASRQ